MSYLTELLLSLGNGDPAVRVPAEQQVAQARQSDLSGFLCAVLLEFSDESKPAFARHMAGTLLKNSIAPNLRDPVARRASEREWMALSSDVRLRVKQGVLSLLGSPMKEVRNVAANIVGNLSRIELPAGEWNDLLNILLSAAESNNEQHQEAALTAVGYVCEEGREHDNVGKALVPFTNRILSAVVHGMSSHHEDVCYYATNALCNAMEFIHDNMKQQEQRDRLLDALCTTAKTSQTPRTREKAMESLVKVADMYYSTLPNYIECLHAITTSAIFQDEEVVGLQAMLFWISICETEQEMKAEGDTRCLNYALKGASMISEIALQALLQQEEQQEEGDWNISIAGGKLLQSLALCIGDPVISLVMPFVYAKVGSADWREKEAAVMAFGCILNGPSANAIQDTVAQALPGLLQYFRDSHPMVADTSGWALAVVCEFFSDVFLEQPTFLQQLMNLITPVISSGGASAVRSCHILHNLALAYEEEENQPTNELSRYFPDLLNVLLVAIDNGINQNVKTVAQEALNVLVDAAAVDCYQYLHILVPELHKRMHAMINLQIQGQLSNAEVMTMLGLLCGSLGSVAKKVQTAFTQHLQSSMAIMLQIFQNQSDTVLDEALTMLGSFAHAVKQGLVPYLTSVAPYVLKALQCVDEPDLAVVAVGALGDLSLSLREEMAPYTDTFLSVIHQHLQNPEVDRELKCTFLNCLGDIALNVGGQYFSQYLDVFMQNSETLYRQSTTLNIAEDPENEEYVMALWESIAVFYTSVCQSFKSAETQLAPYLQTILQFALYASTTAMSLDYVDVSAAAVSLIGDMACVLKSVSSQELRQQGKSALLTDVVWDVVNRAAAMDHDPEAKGQMQWVAKQLGLLQAS
ncbi:putative importin beta-1 subunit [Trypanosoma rangeli]|uniref:Putative importin beta-1 subunit n=1 Tax=Trypanosoma rangeli TaxID=5698 RepID=A0A3R7LLX8_TRYRA|nr:putative importin beta-1 subunit [Trypanosoma rangeli]RNE99671.1 putative importin beta-1 subunit [Trypanosoma rangeli]|eukprot:RNE99671.1 putative importin beta-1 subunit [Trypanosoma rangeli]